jgi:hypothetical protein
MRLQPLPVTPFSEMDGGKNQGLSYQDYLKRIGASQTKPHEPNPQPHTLGYQAMRAHNAWNPYGNQKFGPLGLIRKRK